MKKRLDILLVEKGYFETRAKAQSNIMASNVLVDDEPITKSGTMISEDSEIRIRNKIEFVSRGAFKLIKALKEFDIKSQNKICADIGSSTGGFTEVLLKNGAKLVYAVDVGTNQLDYKLRIDDRVIVMENTNARYIDSQLFTHSPSLITIDVSFISLNLIIKPILDVLEDDGDIIALIKPQFEIGKDIKDFRGVVKKRQHHFQSLKKVFKYLLDIEKPKIDILGFSYSPIKGPKGNKEFLVHIKKTSGNNYKQFNDSFFERLIQESDKAKNKH